MPLGKSKTKTVTKNAELDEARKNASTGTTSKSTGVFCETCGAEIPTQCFHCEGKIPEKKARELHEDLAH